MSLVGKWSVSVFQKYDDEINLYDVKTFESEESAKEYFMKKCKPYKYILYKISKDTEEGFARVIFEDESDKIMEIAMSGLSKEDGANMIADILHGFPSYHL